MHACWHSSNQKSKMVRNLPYAIRMQKCVCILKIDGIELVQIFCRNVYMYNMVVKRGEGENYDNFLEQWQTRNRASACDCQLWFATILMMQTYKCLCLPLIICITFSVQCIVTLMPRRPLHTQPLSIGFHTYLYIYILVCM